MAGLISNLLLLTIQYVIMDCTRRTTKMVYKPYGPKICRQLCEDLGGTFYFVPEHLSCHPVPTTEPEDSIKNSTKHCLMEVRRSDDAPDFSVKQELSACSNLHKGVYQSNLLPLTAEATGGGDLHLGPVSPNVSLHQAFEEGMLCTVHIILSQRPAAINTRDKLGRTPIMAAVMNNQVTVFYFLVSQRCDLMAADNNNDTVLHVACAVGNVDIVRQLVVDHTCDIESRGGKGMTPVMKSALHGHRDVVEVLVSKGCYVTTLDDSMNNILHVACSGGHVDVVMYILRTLHTDIESRGEMGRTPVLIAAHSGHVGVVDFLASKGSNLSAVDNDKDNILHVACIGGQVDMVQHILSKTLMHIESRGKYGRTPVMRAAQYGHRSVVDVLVSKHCNIKTVDDTLNNLLHVACIGGHVDMVKYILSQQMGSTESKGQSNRTPVMVAAYYCQTSVFMFLVNRGCKLTMLDKYKNNILHLSCKGGRVDIVKYIVEKLGFGLDSRSRWGWTPVMFAAGYCHASVVKYLLSKGCKLTTVKAQLDNVLHVACRCDNVDVVKCILSHTDVLTDSRGALGNTPVMVAADYGHESVFMFLVKQGCTLKALDTTKSNILHLACRGGNVNIVKYIVEKRIFGIESRGDQGWTPVMNAALYGKENVFMFLKSQGCKLRVLSRSKKNLLHLACTGGNAHLVKFIVEKLGFGIEQRGEDGWTPVMNAAYYGHVSVVQYLVGKGCKLAKDGEKGPDILELACKGHYHKALVKYLMTIKSWPKPC